MLKLRTILLFASILFLNQAISQTQWIDTSKHQGLTKAQENYPFEVYTTSTTLASASNTLETLSDAKLYFDKLFDIDLPFAVLLLDNNSWNKYAYYPPPGMPQAWNGNVILGLDKSVLATQVAEALANLPPGLLIEMKKVYGDPLDLDLFYRDALSIHELAHLYQFYRGSRSQRRWLSELFATMSMVAFFNQSKCESCTETMNTYPEFVRKGGDQRMKFKTLNEFENKYLSGMGPQNYEWFQMQFHKSALDILNQEGIEVVPKFYRFLIDTDLSKSERFSDKELAQALTDDVGISVADVLLKWKHK